MEGSEGPLEILLPREQIAAIAPTPLNVKKLNQKSR
jgi:hypothetical protein